jgi:hypothetical protein
MEDVSEYEQMTWFRAEDKIDGQFLIEFRSYGIKTRSRGKDLSLNPDSRITQQGNGNDTGETKGRAIQFDEFPLSFRR